MTQDCVAHSRVCKEICIKHYSFWWWLIWLFSSVLLRQFLQCVFFCLCWVMTKLLCSSYLTRDGSCIILILYVALRRHTLNKSLFINSRVLNEIATLYDLPAQSVNDEKHLPSILFPGCTHCINNQHEMAGFLLQVFKLFCSFSPSLFFPHDEAT